MAVDSVRWIVRQYDLEPWFNSTLYEYYALGDTLVNDTVYKKIYKRTLNSTNYNPPYPATSEYFLVALMRDDIENRKVYSIIFEEVLTICPTEEDVLLFDFSLNQGDLASHQCTVPDICGEVFIEETGDGTFYGVSTRYFQLEGLCSSGLNYYEGIGSERGLFEELFTPVKGTKLMTTRLDYYCPTSDCPFIVSSNQLHAPTGLKTYPNPAQDYVVFELKKTIPSGYITICDITGRQVANMALTGEKTVWETAGLKPGVYLYKLQTPEGFGSGKLLISP